MRSGGASGETLTEPSRRERLYWLENGHYSMDYWGLRGGEGFSAG